jgi:hypothetical protein
LIIIGVSIHQEDTNIPNLDSPNNVASKKKKKKHSKFTGLNNKVSKGLIDIYGT